MEGVTTKFEIWTDHKNLKYFLKAQKLNQRQARWALYLSRFDFVLKHVPGSKMGKADSLSKRPDWEIGVEKDNEDETLVKPEWLEVRKTEVVEIIVDRVDLLEEVNEKLRAEIIRLHHDTPIGGHGGQWKMVELVTRNFW